MANFPETKLGDGELDDEYGGQPANQFDTDVWAFNDAQKREAHSQIIDDQWAPRRFVRATIASGGVAGDVLVFLLSALSSTYTIKRVSDQAYVPGSTIYFGVLEQATSAAAVGKVAVHGILGPSITGLGVSAAGPITFDTATARLTAAAPGDPVVGYLNDKGYLFLYGPNVLVQ